MEMGSSSLTESGGSSSSPPNSESLIFGHKIYFEDVGLGAPPKSSGGSSSKSGSGTAAQPRKARSGVVQGAQPPRCQVEGCRVDLSDVKAYYSRHKVCSMHSKTPKVIVAGLEQRFCQQCSRFHQLPEFDQGKRSCRRRLAGHNERRRKPPPGSLFSSRYGGLAPSVHESSSRAGSFVMDFSAYPRVGRDAWSATRLPDQNQVTATGKYLPHHPWHGNPENPSFVPGGPTIPPGNQCYAGDSTCALSLLSNQPWGSGDRASSGLGLMNPGGVPVSQPTAVTRFPNTSWGFEGNGGGGNAHGMVLDLGSGQNQFSGEMELPEQGRRHYVDVEHSRPYDSAPQMHWSL